MSPVINNLPVDFFLNNQFITYLTGIEIQNFLTYPNDLVIIQVSYQS
jgi:hypothetical protein